MPKHDEPITMAEHDAREKAALLALAIKDKAKATRMEEEDALRIRNSVGKRSGFRKFKFTNDDKERIRGTMPCTDDVVAENWINRIEIGIDPYRAWRTESVADIRKRLTILAGAATALDRDILRLLETAYDPRWEAARRSYWREANISHAVTLMSAAAQDALQAVQTNGGRDANIGVERLARSIAQLWIAFSGRTAKSKLEGLDEHASAILDCLKKNKKPSEEYFLQKVRQIVTNEFPSEKKS